MSDRPAPAVPDAPARYPSINETSRQMDRFEAARAPSPVSDAPREDCDCDGVGMCRDHIRDMVEAVGEPSASDAPGGAPPMSEARLAEIRAMSDRWPVPIWERDMARLELLAEVDRLRALVASGTGRKAP
jgi:hypothetical protein